MILTCSRRELHEAVQTVARAAAAQSALPILRHLLLAPQNGSLQLTATDSELYIRTSLAVRGEWTEGVAAPARLFHEILNSLPEGDVQLELTHGDLLVLRQGDIRFELKGLPPAEFPSLPVVHTPGDDSLEVQLSQETMRRLLRQTSFAVGLEPTRVQYTGILFEREERTFRLVATDGVVRVSVSAVDLPEPAPPIGAIVPARAVQEMIRIVKPEDATPVTLYFRNDFIGPTLASFEANGVLLVTRLIEGQFTPWRRVVPSDRKLRATVRCSEIMSALRRMALVAADDQNRVQLTLTGDALQLSCFSTTLGSAEETIPVLSQGGEMLIALNGRYLAEAIDALQQEGCHLDLTGGLSPCVVRPLEGESYLYVQSPMHPR